jgi:YfiH family protein
MTRLQSNNPPISLPLLTPEWPAPPGIRALQTTRAGGVSTGAYASLNLGGHTADAPSHVRANRARLAEAAGLPGPVPWLRQVHGNGVVRAETRTPGGATEGDAVTAHTPGRVCAVLTADCLPVLLCRRDGGAVAAAHAGWRGLAAGVLAGAVAALDARPETLLAWLGPAIGPAAFEVGAEVRAAFLADDPGAAPAFTPGPVAGKYFADLYALARRALLRAGLERSAIHGGGRCTFSELGHFFSHRRDGHCGRMASLIWITQS